MIVTRRFILAAAALGACFTAARASPFASAESCDAAIRLRSLIPAPGSGREIGRVYLAKCPEEAGASALTPLILSSLSLEEGDVAGLEFQALSAKVAMRVRSDFEQGDIVDIDGWILSRTETRLCALWT
jgi:hypothetical protein